MRFQRKGTEAARPPPVPRKKDAAMAMGWQGGAPRRCWTGTSTTSKKRAVAIAHFQTHRERESSKISLEDNHIKENDGEPLEQIQAAGLLPSSRLIHHVIHKLDNSARARWGLMM
jgi:hypothetical protein